MAKRIIGIDVGKEKLDAALNGQKRVKSWANDETDRAKLAAWVVDQQVALVVVEASGGYEARIVSELVERGQAVALVNPTRVRAFARAAGVLAKTDKIDARTIAYFGATMAPRAQARRSQAQLA
jgi:transposase